MDLLGTNKLPPNKDLIAKTTAGIDGVYVEVHHFADPSRYLLLSLSPNEAIHLAERLMMATNSYHKAANRRMEKSIHRMHRKIVGDGS